MIYDLHTHTTISDGKLSPKELVDYAIEKGLEGIAITDHDKIDGISEAVGYAKDKNIEVVPGIEISCDCEEKVKEVHIVGLFIDYSNPEFERIKLKARENSKKTTEKILKELEKLGFEVNIKDMEKGGRYGRPAIAELLMKKYPNDFPDRKFVFDEYLGTDGKIKIMPIAPSMGKGIDTIHKAGGIAILAHPGYFREHDDYFIEKFMKLGGDGIEVGCGYACFENRDELNYKYLRIAEKNDLLISLGTDFHEKKEYKDLGDYVTSEKDFLKMRNRSVIKSN